MSMGLSDGVLLSIKSVPLANGGNSGNRNGVCRYIRARCVVDKTYQWVWQFFWLEAKDFEIAVAFQHVSWV